MISPTTDHPRRSADAHQAILKAAVEVATDRGYSGATIEDVARSAGVGKQTIYRWWGAKVFLYLEVYQALVPPAALSADMGAVRADLRQLLGTRNCSGGWQDFFHAVEMLG